MRHFWRLGQAQMSAPLLLLNARHSVWQAWPRASAALGWVHPFIETRSSGDRDNTHV
jgi:hypothetical protein